MKAKQCEFALTCVYDSNYINDNNSSNCLATEVGDMSLIDAKMVAEKFGEGSVIVRHIVKKGISGFYVSKSEIIDIV